MIVNRNKRRVFTEGSQMRAGLPGLIRRATSETPVAGKEGHGREHRPLPNVDELCWTGPRPEFDAIGRQLDAAVTDPSAQ